MLIDNFPYEIRWWRRAELIHKFDTFLLGKNWQYFSSRIYQILQQNAILAKLYFLLLELNEYPIDIFSDFIIN